MPLPQNDNLDPYANDLLSSYIDEGEDGTLDTILSALDEDQKAVELEKGGEGSGNFGHAGRPGEVGGSSTDGAAGSTATLETPEIKPVSGETKLRDFIAPERWGTEFTTAVKTAITEAKAHLVIAAPIAKADTQEGFDAHLKDRLEYKLHEIDGAIQISEKDLKEVTERLDSTKKEFDIANANTANPMTSDVLATFTDRLNYYPKLIQQYTKEIQDRKYLREQFDKQGAKVVLETSLNRITTKLSEAMSLGEQQGIMDAAKISAITYLNKTIKTGTTYQQKIADIYYSVIRNREAQFATYSADNINSYMEKHYASVLADYDTLSDKQALDAKRAVEGIKTSPTVQKQENFKLGKERILAMFSPKMLSQVPPITWAGKRGAGGRSWYKAQIQTIELSKDDRPGTIPHEYAHHAEFSIPQIIPFFSAYWNERTQGNQSKSFGAGYRSYERTKLDQWVEPYMGHYNVGMSSVREGGEIFSMSVGMLANPKDAARLYQKDPELFGITMAILKGKYPGK